MADWDYTAMMSDENDSLGVPFAGPGWQVPEQVQLVKEQGEDYLEFDWDGLKIVSLRRDMLTTFVELAVDETIDPIAVTLAQRFEETRLSRIVRRSRIAQRSGIARLAQLEGRSETARQLETELRSEMTRLSETPGIQPTQIAWRTSKPTGDLNRALAFAGRFGPLGLCGRHNRSHWHIGSVPCIPAGLERRDGRIVRTRERVDGWFAYSRAARSILNLVALPKPASRRIDLDRAQQLFDKRFSGPVAVVNRWLAECRILLQVEGKRSRLGLFPLPACLAQLGIQLALVVAGRQGMAVCAGCARFFATKSQPRRDRNHYCPKCGLKTAWRDAQRRKRNKPNC